MSWQKMRQDFPYNLIFDLDQSNYLLVKPKIKLANEKTVFDIFVVCP